MNRLSFQLQGISAQTFQIMPMIDDRALLDMILEFELSQGYRPAGGYGGLMLHDFANGIMAAWFPHSTANERESTVLLACDCGEVECWPLLAHIKRDGTRIVWSQFSQPHRPEWRYSGFDTLVFDAKPYETALSNLTARLS